MTLASLFFILSLAQDPDATCAECHPSIAERYARHGMARTLTPEREVDLSPIVGRERNDPATGFRYGIERDEDGAWLVERRRSPPGFADHEQRRRIVAVIGAGKMDRSFVIEQAGRWYFAPVEWATGHGLVLAPHQELSPQSRLGFPITAECLSCHSDTPPATPYPLNLDDGFPRRGIGCAGCHGDGSRHVESGGEPGTIADLGALSLMRQLDVCARCHLQGDARVELRRDAEASFAPGDDLFADRAAFVAAHPTDDFGFVSQSGRLALSRCFTESGGMTCTRCHDPHEPTRDTPPEAYDRACLSCHQEQACRRPAPTDRGGATCASCHMRRSAPHDLRHVQVTDHFIRKRPPPPKELSRLRVHTSEDADLKRFSWPGESARRDAIEDAGALAMALTHRNFPLRALPLFEQVLDGPGDHRIRKLPAFHFMRGRALEAAGRAAEAEQSYREALALEPGHAESAVNLGLLLARRGSAEARVVLDEVARRHPRADAPHRNLALLHYRSRDAAAFESALRRALELDPSLAPVRLQLGTFLLQTGRLGEAARELDRARSHDPDLPRVWSRLGIALFETGDRDRARFAFEEALRRDPEDQDARLGLSRLKR